MPLFTSKPAGLIELVAYFMATIAIGFGAGLVLSMLQRWLEAGQFGLDLTLSAAVAALAGICFVVWAVNVASARRRTVHWRR